MGYKIPTRRRRAMHLHLHPLKPHRLIPIAVILSVSLLAIGVVAQTVHIDAAPSHVANTFSPLRALGTTVDRIPSNTTDVFCRPDQVKHSREAGWGPVWFRHNPGL